MSQIIALGALVAMFFAAFFPSTPIRTAIDGAQSVRAVVQQAASKVDIWTDKGATSSKANVAATLEGKVVGVSDGDTITLLDKGNRQHRIRLMGICGFQRSRTVISA